MKSKEDAFSTSRPYSAQSMGGKKGAISWGHCKGSSVAKREAVSEPEKGTMG